MNVLTLALYSDPTIWHFTLTPRSGFCMLDQYRVLDLADEKGILCGYLFAQLGAQVVAIEPTGGSAVRSMAPLVEDKGLWWEAYARGKESLELDIESDEGKRRFEALVQEVDFVIDSFAPGEREKLGLRYERLAMLNPALIQVSITPFGQTGPKAEWPASDLTVWAACGAHFLAGDSDLAPVRTSVPQSYMHAGADAVCAALIALQARHKSGLGQHVDVSAQQSSAQAALSVFLGPHNNSELVAHREAGGMAGKYPVKMTWPCNNGYVAITMMLGPAFREPNRRLLRWVAEEGYCSHEEAEDDWGEKIAEMTVDGSLPEPYFELCKKIEQFTMQHTREELFEEGLARGVYIAPTLDISGLLAEHHFHSRDYWQQITIAGKDVRVPGPLAKLTKSPLKVTSPAPDLNCFKGFHGEKTAVISTDPASEELPLTGLKVLDFTWAFAGPTLTRVLVDYGATVIKVESSIRFDPARSAPPYKDDEQNLNASTPFANFNGGKMSITINPANEMGKQVLLDLVKWADVVTESYSPKAMKSWGLDYESLTAVNPELIMLSSCLMGQTGDRALVPGYGNMAAAITGFYELTGWAERSPAGPYLAYTDAVSPRFMLASLMSALEHKRVTGNGQYIDVSQAEAAIHFLVPAILDYELSGNIWRRMGNRDLSMCPHGVFQAAGADKWVAIVCQTDDDWYTLCSLAEFDEFGADEDLRTATGRKLREDEIEARLAAWCSDQTPGDLVSRLIDAGIAAHEVQGAHECKADPQLGARGHFVEAAHTSLDHMVIEGSRFRLSRTPAQVTKAGPDLGEHNVEVLTEILGYDMDKVADVFASLAME
jgi:crotonobetainyl-CoA:carnitine CoA-transferase CaiB-like acyl-CoA transferase